MNRRTLGASLLSTALAGAALAEEPPSGEEERGELVEAARLGAFSLAMSALAERLAQTPRVRQFAGFEVAEHTVLSEILQDVRAKPAPALGPEQEATLAQLKALSATNFDPAYVTAQIELHQKLLNVQDRLLNGQPGTALRHLTMLARGLGREHQRLLDDIQRRRPWRG